MIKQIKKIPVFGNIARKIYWLVIGNRKQTGFFPGSEKYWEQRYSSGGNSGVGSYNQFAQFKAEIINTFVDKHSVKTVIEFGCGDGNQLLLANYPSYIGIDVSQKVVDLCVDKFSGSTNKQFKLMKDHDKETAELSLSLDVIYHLVEDEVFEAYMQVLFKAANRYVIIYSSDSDDNSGCEGSHVRHRRFTKWIQNNIHRWELIKHIPNKYPYIGDNTTGSFADFYMYEKF